MECWIDEWNETVYIISSSLFVFIGQTVHCKDINHIVLWNKPDRNRLKMISYSF